jgi:hypothetical protein
MSLLADNIQNEVVTIHRSQEMLKMVTLYTQTFLSLAEEVLIYPSKLFCRNTFNFFTNILFYFFRSGVTVVDFVLLTTPEEKISRIKIG